MCSSFYFNEQVLDSDHENILRIVIIILYVFESGD